LDFLSNHTNHFVLYFQTMISDFLSFFLNQLCKNTLLTDA
jgi:hypothetical protein